MPIINNDKEFADPKLLEHWLPVDLYVGGPEHAVGHLLYSRIWNNYLYASYYQLLSDLIFLAC